MSDHSWLTTLGIWFHHICYERHVIQTEKHGWLKKATYVAQASGMEFANCLAQYRDTVLTWALTGWDQICTAAQLIIPSCKLKLKGVPLWGAGAAVISKSNRLISDSAAAAANSCQCIKMKRQIMYVSQAVRGKATFQKHVILPQAV